MRARTYSKMCTFSTLFDRFNYLKLDGIVGSDTFGSERYLNQSFYRSEEWRRIRNLVITRDNGCELGLEGYEIQGPIIIHHINPLFPEDILNATDFLVSLENLVCVSDLMHKAIHYGDNSILNKYSFAERKPGDTTLWRKDI